MDDKLIQALIVSEQLKESRLDEAGKAATVWQMAKNAGKAMLNKVPGAQTVKKVANGVQNAYKTAANQVDDKKNTETIKKCVDLLAKQLCKQMFAANSDEKAMKNLMPVLTKNYGIPQDVVKAAYKEVQANANGGDKGNANAQSDPNAASKADPTNQVQESARAYRVSRMLHITEEENNGNQEANNENNEANKALSLLGNVYKNKFDLAALSKVWESLKTNNATKQLFVDQKFKQLSDAVDAMITANNQGQQQAQEGGEAEAKPEEVVEEPKTDATAGGTGEQTDNGQDIANGSDAGTDEQPAAPAQTGAKPEATTEATGGSEDAAAKEGDSKSPEATFNKEAFSQKLNDARGYIQGQLNGKIDQTLQNKIEELLSVKNLLGESRKMNYAYILNESADPFADFDKMTGFTGADEKDLCRPFDEGYAHCQQAMQSGKCGPQPKKVPYPRHSKEAEDYVSGWETAWADGDDFIRR